MKNEKIQGLVLAALFTAIIVVMTFTSLGYIPLGVINATIIHIPVIIGSLFLGPKKGVKYRIQVGPFKNKTEAKKIISAMRDNGCSAYISR